VATLCPVRDLDGRAGSWTASAGERHIDLHQQRSLAREFAHRATASMVGVNIGVAAPMA
jgi:hypothetical protein